MESEPAASAAAPLDTDVLPEQRTELFAAVIAESRANQVNEEEISTLQARLKACNTYGEYNAVVADEKAKLHRRSLQASDEPLTLENESEFARFLSTITDPEVARGYQALVVGSQWMGTYQHRAMPGYTFPYTLEVLSRSGWMLTARQTVDFPPAMGGKSADLLFDMRISRVAQSSFGHASPSGVWLEVVNVDKERMQYSWRLSGAEHSLCMACTLRGNTGVQDFLAYRKWPNPPRPPQPTDGPRTSASARTSFTECTLQ